MWPRQHRVTRGQGKNRANEHTAVAPTTPETNSKVLEGRVASSSYEGLGRSNGPAVAVEGTAYYRMLVLQRSGRLGTDGLELNFPRV